MKSINDILIDTHGNEDLDITKVKKAMVIYGEQKSKSEREEIRDLIYNSIPIGEVTTWDCVQAFKQLLADIDNRI